MDDFEVDGVIYRREGWFDDIFAAERRKAFLSWASPPQRAAQAAQAVARQFAQGSRARRAGRHIAR